MSALGQRLNVSSWRDADGTHGFKQRAADSFDVSFSGVRFEIEAAERIDRPEIDLCADTWVCRDG